MNSIMAMCNWANNIVRFWPNMSVQIMAKMAYRGKGNSRV